MTNQLTYTDLDTDLDTRTARPPTPTPPTTSDPVPPRNRSAPARTGGGCWLPAARPLRPLRWPPPSPSPTSPVNRASPSCRGSSSVPGLPPRSGLDRRGYGRARRGSGAGCAAPAYLIIQDEIDAALADRNNDAVVDDQRPAHQIVQDEIDAASAGGEPGDGLAEPVE